NCIEKLSNTKVLDTFSLKKAIAFFKENTRTDENIPWLNDIVLQPEVN
ncbi:hypothetical protein PMI10_03499, partial [Flavobacterium sp. CF136]